MQYLRRNLKLIEKALQAALFGNVKALDPYPATYSQPGPFGIVEP